jgi:flagellar hook-length control protein FliK
MAAAPQALLLPSVQKKGAAAKAPAQSLPSDSQGSLGRRSPGGVAAASRSAADAFSRIVQAKLAAKDSRAGRPQGAEGARGAVGAGGAPGAGALGGLSGEEAAPQSPEGVAKGAAAAARKKSIRSRDASAMAGEGDSPVAGDTRDPVGRLPSRQGEARRDSSETSAASAGSVGRKGAEPRVSVLDLRKAPEQAADEPRALGRVLPSQTAEKDAGGIHGTGRAATREVAAPGAKARTGRTGGAPAPFESALERLRAMAGSELVKTTGIILRDGGGEIRLVLKPESLGSVRIRMNLVDNGIEGRIIVDTLAVKQVFDGNIDALEKALTAQGFQSASIEVSVGGQNAGGGRTAEQPASALRRESADGFERNVPGIESLSLGDLLVNLFA